MKTYRPKQTTSRNKILMVIFLSITTILMLKLFQLQVLAHEYYNNIASREQFASVELPAQRGEIMISDYHSGEEFLVATNTTLYLIYADPYMIENPEFVGEILHPYIFDLEEAKEKDLERIEELRKEIPLETPEEEVAKLLTPLNDEELKEKHKQDLIDTLQEKQRKEILLVTSLEENKLKQIEKARLAGIKIEDGRVYAYPEQIKDRALTADIIGPLLEIPSIKLETILKGQNRYVILKRKIPPDVSEQINKHIDENPDQFLGIGMQEEYYRYYPEGALGANVIGYSDGNNQGQYGIEKFFNEQLKGKAGTFQAKKDSIGRQITVGDSVIEKAVQGDQILLTIDRSVQLKVDTILENAVKRYRAHSGQIIVMNPKDASIIALSHYPTFNPNSFGEVFNLEEIELSPEQIDGLVETKDENIYYLYLNEVTLERIKVIKDTQKDGSIKYFKYINNQGPEVYHNKAVAWPYEPGSTFKTIAMAIGIDDKDITPNSTFNDSGPIGVDWNPYKEDYDFFIKNSGDYKGLVDMNTVLAESLNTGMTYIGKKMGAALFYDYIKKFGFLDPTNIELADEQSGYVEFYDDWSESELATHTFGQGITVNLIQLANAYSAIANGGLLMKPYIVKEVRHDNGKTTTNQKKEIRRVVSEETSNKMIAMLVHSTEKGVANEAQVENHYVAGKTGTSQTYRNGQAIEGVGTTIASFAGFGPVDDPQFVIIVKLDKPKTNQWGSKTAAPTFREVASYLFDYYNIPPDK